MPQVEDTKKLLEEEDHLSFRNALKSKELLLRVFIVLSNMLVCCVRSGEGAEHGGIHYLCVCVCVCVCECVCVCVCVFKETQSSKRRDRAQKYNFLTRINTGKSLAYRFTERSTGLPLILMKRIY